MKDKSDAVAKKLPFVSVIVPTYNRGDLLVDLLDSLLHQTYPAEAFELIVVDNGSSDDTDDVVRDFIERVPFEARYFKKNFNGPAASRDFALGECAGEIVAFIDSDCVATPEWLEQGVSAMSPTETRGGSPSGGATGLVQGRTIPNPNQQRHLIERTVNVTSEGPCYETCNIFYRKEALDEVGGFSPEYEEFGYPYFGEDIDLAWKVKGAGYESAFADDALVYHHVFRPTPWQWLTEPRNAMTWPYIVKKFPHLRRFMYGRYFLTCRTALFDLLLGGLVLAFLFHWAFLLCAAPYVVMRYMEGEKYRSPVVRGGRIVVCLPRAVVLFVALTVGSLRFRCLLI